MKIPNYKNAPAVPTFANGFGSLEQRTLLAADLFVAGLTQNNVVTPLNVGNGNEVVNVTRFAVNNDPAIPFGPGHHVDLNFQIGNAGDDRVNRPQVAAIWDTDNDLSNGYVRVIDSWTAAGAVNPASNATPSVPSYLGVQRRIILPPDAAINTTYFLHLVPDPNGFILENDEFNNLTNTSAGSTAGTSSNAVPIFITSGNNKVDLIGTQFNYTSEHATAVAGEDVEFTYSIRNTGFNFSNAFTARFYLSKFNNINNDGNLNGANFETISESEDFLLGTQDWTSGLAPNATGERIATFTLPDVDDPFWRAANGLSINENYLFGLEIVQATTNFLDETEGLRNNGLTLNNSNNGTEFYSTNAIGLDAFNNVSVFFDPTGFADIDGDGAVTPEDTIDIGTKNWDQTVVYTWVRPDLNADPYWDWDIEFIDLTPPAAVDNFKVLSPPAQFVPGAPYQVEFTVYNHSKVASGDFDIDFYISRDTGINTEEDTFIGTTRGSVGATGLFDDPAFDPLDDLRMPAFTTFTTTLTLPFSDDPFWEAPTTTSYFLGAVINPPETTNPPDGFEQEEDEYRENANLGFNYDMLAITVDTTAIAPPGSPGTPASGADLVPDTFTLNQSTVKTSGKLDFSFTVRNDGAFDANATTVAVYASLDAIINPETDQFIGEFDVPALAAGATSPVINISNNIRVKAPHPGAGIFANSRPSTLHFGLFADSGTSVVETDETNNASNQAVNANAIDSIAITGIRSVADKAGNSATNAQEIPRVGSRAKTRRDFVGETDTSDWWTFTTTGRSETIIRSNSKRDDLSLTLLDRNGDQVAFADSPGRRNERIETTLPSGRYFIVIRQVDSNSNSGYRLQLRAALINPNNALPTSANSVLAASTPFTFSESNQASSSLLDEDTIASLTV